VKERKKDGAYDKALSAKNDKCQEANHMVGHAGELKLPNKARHAQKPGGKTVIHFRWPAE